jgi:hypothetical protein
MSRILTDGQVSEFSSNGVIVIPDFYRTEEILPIKRGIYDVIGHVMIKNGISDTREPFTPETFDQGYMELIRKNRVMGGEVYDGIKQIPAFLRLVAHPVHETVMSELRAGAQPGVAAGGYGIRIDNPFEDKFRAMWHQEYPAQLRSSDGLVFWSPLISVTQDLGPVDFCLGSQTEGPLPVCQADPEGVGRSGAYALQIHNVEKFISKYKKFSPLTKPGDLVIIDFLVLHASGYNRGTRPRWTMQFRYFNFAEPTGRSHAWRGSFAAGEDFSKIHPELYISNRA